MARTGTRNPIKRRVIFQKDVNGLPIGLLFLNPVLSGIFLQQP